LKLWSRGNSTQNGCFPQLHERRNPAFFRRWKAFGPPAAGKRESEAGRGESPRKDETHERRDVAVRRDPAAVVPTRRGTKPLK
jgi:hypothetical protein